MTFHTTKGMMGIGTLIIFIATILVAAVAAAVLISTSNVLQQRSLLVGQEARKAITDAVEVVSILSASDSTTETFNNFEILVRLSPGSDPLQMRKFNIQYISPTFDQAAELLYDDNETTREVGSVNATANATLYDLDGDGQADRMRLFIDDFGTYEGVAFYLTDLGNWSDHINLYENLATAGTTNVTISTAETAITHNESIYGYLIIRGTTNVNNVIIAAVNVTVSEVPDACEFDLLPPESSYCYKIMNGNDDFVLGSGERFKLLYRTKEEHELGIGQDFMFIFASEKGRLSEARARSPDVVTSTKTKLWPLG